MLKRIHIQHLTLGMYLHEFCGSWMDHPFWRAKFLLKDPGDLARIQATAIQEIWIDTDKGLDGAAGAARWTRRVHRAWWKKFRIPSPATPARSSAWRA